MKSGSSKTPATWKEVGSRKTSLVAEKKRTGMGSRTKPFKKN